MKKCACCQQLKNFTEFNKCKTYADGLNTLCRPCARHRMVEFRAKRKQGMVPLTNNEIKERFMYHAVIDEIEIDKQSFLTYGEILEIVQKVCK